MLETTFVIRKYIAEIHFHPMNFLLNIDSLQTLNRQQPSDRLRVKFMFDRMNESE